MQCLSCAAQELSAEETAARRNKLAKMRALLFYHEQKAKHVKAIKSKEYRRKLNKAARRKARDGAGAEGDSAALRAAAEDAEFERAKVLLIRCSRVEQCESLMCPSNAEVTVVASPWLLIKTSRLLFMTGFSMCNASLVSGGAQRPSAFDDMSGTRGIPVLP